MGRVLRWGEWPKRIKLRQQGEIRVEAIIRRILEAARAACGDPPRSVPTARVIRHALQAAGDLSPASRRALADETNPSTPSVDQYHEVLVRLVYSGPPYLGPLLEGSGNFGAVCIGNPDAPPTHPRYTSCRITPRGLQYLADTAELGAAPDPAGG